MEATSRSGSGLGLKVEFAGGRSRGRRWEIRADVYASGVSSGEAGVAALRASRNCFASEGCLEASVERPAAVTGIHAQQRSNPADQQR